MPQPLSVDHLAVVLRALGDSDRGKRAAALAVLRVVPVGADVVRAAASFGVQLHPADDVQRAVRPPPGSSGWAEHRYLNTAPAGWPRLTRALADAGYRRPL